MIQNLWNSFYSAFASGSQGPVVWSAAKPKKEAETKTKQLTTREDDLKVENPVDEEINQLARALGGIHRGQTIELTLQQLLEYVPKKRRRSDSYARLVKNLKNSYEIELKIVSGGKKDGR